MGNPVTDDLVSRLDDQGLFNKAARIAMFKEARNEIVRLRAALADTTLRNSVIAECELAARGAVYEEIYNGGPFHNWSRDSEYGRGRHAAADAVRALYGKSEQ